MKGIIMRKINIMTIAIISLLFIGGCASDNYFITTPISMASSNGSSGNESMISNWNVSGTNLYPSNSTYDVEMEGDLTVNGGVWSNFDICVLGGNCLNSAKTYPAGSTKELQYNDAGSFGASSNLVWDNSNIRLGIGTSSPTGNLNIYRSSTQANIHLQTGSSTHWASHQIKNNLGNEVAFYHFGSSKSGSYAGVSAANLGMLTYSGTNSLMFRTNKAMPLYFVTYNVNRMMITGNGYVGIGTITPKNILDVEGGAVIGATYSGGNTAPTNGLLIEGNVGIGTTNPSESLQVIGNINVTGCIRYNGGVLGTCI